MTTTIIHSQQKQQQQEQQEQQQQTFKLWRSGRQGSLSENVGRGKIELHFEQSPMASKSKY